jgi:hypothetical protein
VPKAYLYTWTRGHSTTGRRWFAWKMEIRQRGEMSRMRFYLSLYLLVAGVYLLTASGRIGLSDSVAMFNVSQSIIDKGSLSSEPCEYDIDAPSAGSSIGCIPGAGGRHYAGYGLVPSLLVVPTILCARFASEVVHVNPLLISKTAASVFTLVCAPLACVVLAAWVLKIGYGRRAAAAAACILGLASPFWHSSVTGFLSEPYFTLALLMAACLLSSPRRKFACAFSGLAFGVACGVRLNGVILFPAFILSLAFYVRARRLSTMQFLRDSVCFAAPLSVCGLLIGLANYERFGSPFRTGYHLAFPSASLLLSNPLLRGLFEVLVTGEVGLLIFAPWVLIALICFAPFTRAHLPESVLCGATFLIYLLFFAKYSDWHGGWVAGPRLLVPVLPFLVVAMTPTIHHLQQPGVLTKMPWLLAAPLLAAFIGAGVLIQSVGTVFPAERYYVLMEFYKHKPERPWWSGSIPLASVDFLTRMSVPKKQSTRAPELDPMLARHEGEAAFASAGSAATEDEYLALFPNPANMTSPNLMLFKFRLMGLPESVGIAYLIAALAIACAGAVGLRRCVAS